MPTKNRHFKPLRHFEDVARSAIVLPYNTRTALRPFLSWVVAHYDYAFAGHFFADQRWSTCGY
jgi:hypothetical protein